jgi:choloylglycine hydrolase
MKITSWKENLMKQNKPLLFLLILTVQLLSAAISIFPCTSFIFTNNQNILLGHNLDWHVGTGLLIVNKKNVRKTAIGQPSEKSIQWVSRYGSITFNQVGRGLPYGGMNESGLVVEQMTLDSTKYPARDSRYPISACQWIQYQLDNCSTIEEVIATDEMIRIVDKTSKFHFLICDSTGKGAVIEFINGEINVVSGEELKVKVLTNSQYDDSVSAYRNQINTGHNRSLDNFCTAARMLDNYSRSKFEDETKYLFGVLKEVSQSNFTKWSIVYDIKNLIMHFKIYASPTITETQILYTENRDAVKIKTVDLNQIDFSCTEPALVMELELEKQGKVNQFFINYSTVVNKKYIQKAFDYFWKMGVPIQLTDKELNELAKYPESFRCMDD